MTVWFPRGQQLNIRVDPSRKSTSFYGTRNLHTGRVGVTPADTMNAKATVQHVPAVRDAHPSSTLLLVWDKAPWHRGQAIRALREANPRLTLHAFPTARPDRNPQDHGWRATRRAVAHNHTQRRLPDLADRFKRHLKQTRFTSSFLAHYTFPVCPDFT